MYVTWKLRGISTFDKHLLVFTEYISCVGRRFPVALTVNVAVICLLSSTPFIRAFFASFQLMCIFQEARKKGGLIKVDNQITWYVMNIDSSCDELLKGKFFVS